MVGSVGLAAILWVSACGGRDVAEPTPEAPVALEQQKQALLPLGLTGATGCAWGSLDCNLCVNGVVSAFNNLRDHGEMLGFNPGGYTLNLAYPSSDHLEGIQ